MKKVISALALTALFANEVLSNVAMHFVAGAVWQTSPKSTKLVAITKNTLVLTNENQPTCFILPDHRTWPKASSTEQNNAANKGQCKRLC